MLVPSNHNKSKKKLHILLCTHSRTEFRMIKCIVLVFGQHATIYYFHKRYIKVLNNYTNEYNVSRNVTQDTKQCTGFNSLVLRKYLFPEYPSLAKPMSVSMVTAVPMVTTVAMVTAPRVAARPKVGGHSTERRVQSSVTPPCRAALGRATTPLCLGAAELTIATPWWAFTRGASAPVKSRAAERSSIFQLTIAPPRGAFARGASASVESWAVGDSVFLQLAIAPPRRAFTGRASAPIETGATGGDFRFELLVASPRGAFTWGSSASTTGFVC